MRVKDGAPVYARHVTFFTPGCHSRPIRTPGHPVYNSPRRTAGKPVNMDQSDQSQRPPATPETSEVVARPRRHLGLHGQILIGLNRPAADVSRGSTAHDILGVAAIVGVQAIDYQKLYPGADARLPGE